MVEGTLQIVGEVVHVIVTRCYNISKMLYKLALPFRDDINLPAFPRSDEMKTPTPPSYIGKPVEKIIPDARNFH